mgnify:FL=1
MQLRCQLQNPFINALLHYVCKLNSNRVIAQRKYAVRIIQLIVLLQAKIISE